MRGTIISDLVPVGDCIMMVLILPLHGVRGFASENGVVAYAGNGIKGLVIFY